MRLLAPALLSLLCAARAALGSAAEPLEEHVAHIGVPLVDSAGHAAQWRTPRFHRIQPAVAPAAGTKSKTAIYVATQQGAIGALNPRNGEIVWRRVLNHTDEVQGFWTGMDVGLYLTGPGATRASLHHALSGEVLWSVPLSFPASRAEAVVPEFAHPGCDAAFVKDRVLLLDGARRVRRVAGHKGVEEWRWDVRDSAPHASLVRLAPSTAHDALHALSLTPHTSLLSSNPSSYSLSSHTLSPLTGELLSTKELGHVSPPRELEGWRGEGKAGGAKDIVVLPLGPTSPASAAKPTGLEPHVLHISTDGTLHASSLASASTHTLKARVGKFVALKEVGMGEKGVAVALRDDGHADVVRVARSAKGDVQLKAVWEFEEDAKDAVYSGAYDKQGNAYINRVFFSPNQHLLNFHVYWVDANEGEGQVTGFSFQWDHDLHGDVLAAPFEVSPVSPFQLVTRAVLATSSGSLRMIQEDRHQWILEEGTTVPVAAVLVDLPERQLSRNVTTVEERRAAAAVRAVLEGERFPDRLARHLVALRRAPAWSAQLGKGLVSSVLEFSFDPRIIVPKAPQVKPKAAGVAPRATPVATVTKSKVPAGGVQAAEIPARRPAIPPVGNRRQQTRTAAVPEGPPPPSSLAPRYANASDVAQLHRDKMGFRKLLVSVSAFGKVYAKDTQTGRYLWEKSLVGFGTGEGTPPPKVNLRLLSVTRPVGAAATASGTVAGESEAAAAAALGPLVSIAAEVLEKGHWVLRIWEINPLTGQFLYGEETQTGAPLLLGTAKDVFLLPVEDAETGQKALGAVDADEALRIWPESPSVLRAFAQIAPSFFFSSVSDEGKRLTGHAVLSGSAAQTVPVWQLPLADGEVVESVSRATTDVVASQGKVLGTRETMYKYLSPHALLVVTREAAARSATVYAVDGVTGNVLYSSRIADGNLTPDSELLATFTENWVAVTYTVAAEASSDAAASELDAPPPKSSKPETRLLSLELYEEESRTLQTWKWSGKRSSFAHDGRAASPAAVRAFAQTYVVPFAVRALGHTRTRYGVTVKALLLATSNGSLFALPRRMLDPRRPVGRKATTAELEEGLAPFDAYIPNDPRLDVGGEYRIEGAKLIVTAPAMLESSSVVYVSGLDELLTRVAPSGTFDMLSPTFNKAQLLLTIAALSGGLIVVRPMVKAKVLKARW